MQLSCEKVRVLEQELARVRVVPEQHVWKVASSVTCRNADVYIVSEMPPDPALGHELDDTVSCVRCFTSNFTRWL